jgi:hypothetical protein
MAWYLVKYRDNFTFNNGVGLNEAEDTSPWRGT